MSSEGSEGCGLLVSNKYILYRLYIIDSQHHDSLDNLMYLWQVGGYEERMMVDC